MILLVLSRRITYRFQIQLFHNDVEEFGNGAISWHGAVSSKARHVGQWLRKWFEKKAGCEDVMSGLILGDWESVTSAQLVV